MILCYNASHRKYFEVIPGVQWLYLQFTPGGSRMIKLPGKYPYLCFLLTTFSIRKYLPEYILLELAVSDKCIFLYFHSDTVHLDSSEYISKLLLDVRKCIYMRPSGSQKLWLTTSYVSMRFLLKVAIFAVFHLWQSKSFNVGTYFEMSPGVQLKYIYMTPRGSQLLRFATKYVFVMFCFF